jgi:hypothetical protein
MEFTSALRIGGFSFDETVFDGLRFGLVYISRGLEFFKEPISSQTVLSSKGSRQTRSKALS